MDVFAEEHVVVCNLVFGKFMTAYTNSAGVKEKYMEDGACLGTCAGGGHRV